MNNPETDTADAPHLSSEQARKLLDRYRVTSDKQFRLKDYDPDDTAGRLIDKKAADALQTACIQRLSALQERLYADGRWAVFCVFQAMDAAGKDGTIKHVLTGVNPQGVQVTSFKAPGPEELAHGFLWRSVRSLPERGRIGIHNRSHYEEVLVVRVHPELLDRQHLPRSLVGKDIWEQRLEAIADFECYLARQGMAIAKFFLHLSKQEQRRRFLARLETPEKNWKFSPADLAERAHWDEYQAAYEAAIAATAAPHAPWFVVPADHKWFAHLVVVTALIETLENLNLAFPEVSASQRATLETARARLRAEGG